MVTTVTMHWSEPLERTPPGGSTHGNKGLKLTTGHPAGPSLVTAAPQGAGCWHRAGWEAHGNCLRSLLSGVQPKPTLKVKSIKCLKNLDKEEPHRIALPASVHQYHIFTKG